MKFGYAISNKEDLFPEIEFAKKHFGFVEINLKQELSMYTPGHISEIREVLDGFQVIGHLLRSFASSEKDKEKLNFICETIKILNEIGAKKIVIHPSDNVRALCEASDACAKKGQQLLIENSKRGPFSRANVLESLVKQVRGSAIAFDVGHALMASSHEMERFLGLENRIKHVHLHDCESGLDHLAFTDKKKLGGIMEKVRKTGYDDTVTLEAFFVLKDGKRIETEGQEKRKMLLQQLGLLGHRSLLSTKHNI